MKEQRVTRASAEDLASRIMQGIASGAEQSVIDFMGAQFSIERGPGDMFTIRNATQSESAQFYLPATVPSSSYAEFLPFIPNELVMLSRSVPDELTMVWWAPREPEILFDDLHAQSLSAEWVPESLPGVPPSNVVHSSYVKDGLQRRVFMSEGIVTLMQKGTEQR